MLAQELTNAHRAAQLALRSVTLRQLLAIWPAFRISHLDETWPAVQAALVPLIQLRGQDSSGLAARYFTDYRAALAVDGTANAVIAGPLPLEQITTALEVTGRATARRLLAQKRLDAADVTFIRVAGSVSRLALKPGRDTILESVRQDAHALGWRRITSASPCEFCVMLAGRGNVYKKSTVDFRAHDHCSCFAAPSY